MAEAHKALQTAVTKHHVSPLQTLQVMPKTKTDGSLLSDIKTDAPLLKESIDDKQVGDFSKDKNKDDHRMMDGKFDWLLKASSPLYSAAKVVAEAAQHHIHQALSRPGVPPVVSGSSLQDQTDAGVEAAGDAGAASGNSTDAGAGDKKKDLSGGFSPEKEGFFFITWIVVLVVVLAVLGLCLMYARKCLGAPEDGIVPPGTKGMGKGGYGTVK